MRLRRKLVAARLLANIQNTLSLLVLRLVLDDGLSQRRLPVERVELADRRVQELVVDRVQIVDDLVADALDRVHFLVLLRASVGGENSIRYDHGVREALQALGVEVVLVAKDDRELLQKQLQDAVEAKESALLLAESLCLSARASADNASIHLFNIFGYLFGNNEWADVLMLGEEDDDFVGSHLDPHISAETVLHDDADEGAHHQVEVKRRKVRGQRADDELEQAQ